MTRRLMGAGCVSTYDRSDRNNTLTAIEAMRASKGIFPKDVPASVAPLL